MAVVAALGLLGVSASGAAASPAGPTASGLSGTINVGPQPNTTPAQGGCPGGYACIWTGAEYSGQLSYWAETNEGCKTHEAFHTFYSFYNATSHDVVTFGNGGTYYPFSGQAHPGATTGNVCLVY
jgi:hypothetical protein